ncbi:hypothetical protein CDAR_601741 [Caerostris darwini]|uniref:Uncharacterized protein n=1 Tax=Caerostris darwini TaxID=1538125 RepID=A0AAV4MLG8_9ARAC|nr:hypothetical protein CDAR_601741 [Caerostris darwini]
MDLPMNHSWDNIQPQRQDVAADCFSKGLRSIFQQKKINRPSSKQNSQPDIREPTDKSYQYDPWLSLPLSDTQSLGIVPGGAPFAITFKASSH